MDKNHVIEIILQGVPTLSVNKMLDVYESENTVLFSIDMKTKYCDVTASTHEKECPALFISVPEDSPLAGSEEADTFVYFPGYPGWDLHSVSSSRYTISVAFVKR